MRRGHAARDHMHIAREAMHVCDATLSCGVTRHTVPYSRVEFVQRLFAARPYGFSGKQDPARNLAYLWCRVSVWLWGVCLGTVCVWPQPTQTRLVREETGRAPLEREKMTY